MNGKNSRIFLVEKSGSLLPASATLCWTVDLVTHATKKSFTCDTLVRGIIK